ncbi:MAG TPA: BatA domain-containing protein [Pirellulales bacterium]|nr:BatA domain-containing protein [Pirellulales bacterium]
MSFLAPLYIAGILAVSLPIVFHLIRRTPQGRQVFSSLMFLSPSPPRLTRRSRLDNLLLLILRGLALALLAFAFARPLFYRQSDMNISEAEGRRIAILVDTSASMRRGDLWTQSVRKVHQVLDGLSPTDEVSLFAFDQRVRPLVSFDEWNEQPHSQRAALVRARTSTLSPTWAETNLGDALATVADAVSDHTKQSSPAARRQVVLISDMQQGSRIEPLQGYEWPSGVLVDVQSVALTDPTNAGLYLVESGPDVETTDQRLRIRVSNEADSTREQLSLAWANKDGPLAKIDPVAVYVPPGQSRIVRVPWPAKGEVADRLILAGDSHDFDNTLYLIPPRQEQLRLVFVGDDAADDTKGLLYYLQEAVAETPRRKVEIIARGAKEPLTGADLLEAQLVVAAAALSDEQASLLHKFIEAGGTVLYVLNDASAGASVARLMNRESLAIEEAAGEKFALIGRVKFDHPLFAPFADPRFADFTKIHFWKHRRIELAAEDSAEVLASFDKGDPFLIQQSIGKGRLLIATSGWHPADSQLALSTKFVPLLGGMFPRAAGGMEKSQRHVFETVELAAADAAGPRLVRRPDGAEHALAADTKAFDSTDIPGIYDFVQAGEEHRLAFNLTADESRTAPLAAEELEHRGARVGTQPTVEQIAERQRQARIFELENRQKMWRWLIVAVLGVLLVETALAGRLAHRTLQPQVSP